MDDTLSDNSVRTEIEGKESASHIPTAYLKQRLIKNAALQRVK